MKQMITLKIHKKAISEREYIKYLGIMVDYSIMEYILIRFPKQYL